MRKQLGIRESYKSDTRAEHTAARRAVRKRIVEALCAGRPLGIAVSVKGKRTLIEDGSGDFLDAVICATQAAWAAPRERYGLPQRMPPGEGWIVSADSAK